MADQITYIDKVKVADLPLLPTINKFRDLDANEIKKVVNDNAVELNAHVADLTIHFTEASIDHFLIQNVGTISHANIDLHILSNANPHQVTKAQVGLSNVDNTSDAAKPISSATQAALNDKADELDLTNHVTNLTNPHNVTKVQLGLGSVDNTSDLDKPISAATQVALNLKADEVDFVGHVNTLTNPHQVTKTQVGLSNVDNVSDLDKPISTQTQTALDTKAQKSLFDAHVANDSNPHIVTKAQVGLALVDNTSDVNKPISIATQTELDLKEIKSDKGAALGYTPLGADGKVPAQYINASGRVLIGAWNATTNDPTLVDGGAGNDTDYYIVTVAGSTPLDGISSWAIGDEVQSQGGAWIKIPSVTAVSTVFGRTGAILPVSGDYNADQITETASNKILTTAERAAIAASTIHDTSDGTDHANVVLNDTHRAIVSGNPHGITATTVGLGNVDNTSDLAKPISTATQVALDLKATDGDLTAHTSDLANPHVVTKAQVGLGSVDDTADLAKPVSTLQQAALDLKTDETDFQLHIGDTLNPHVVTKTQVGLSNVTNTSDEDKPVSIATQAALDLKNDVVTFDNHANDATIHFTQAQMDHLVILNRGTNTHAQIDTHIATILNPHGANLQQTSVDYVPQATPLAHAEGRVWYDNVRKTLSVFNDVADMTLNLGEESVIRIFNDTGVTIFNGQAVRAVSSAAGLPTVVLSQADLLTNAQVTGVATHDIANNTAGYITTIGSVGGLDTSLLTEGSTLYLSATVAGGYTQTEQAILHPVAIVLLTDATVGQIYVKPRGIINILAEGQVRGGVQTQGITTTPEPIVSFDLGEFAVNVDVTQVQSPVGGENGYSGQISPATIGATGFYRFFFSCSISGTANTIHTFELYADGVPTGVLAQIDLTNQNLSAGNCSFTGISEAVLTEVSVVEIYAYTAAGASTLTYNSSLFGIERIGNA